MKELISRINFPENLVSRTIFHEKIGHPDQIFCDRPIKENKRSFAAVVQGRVHAMVGQLRNYRDTSHERMHKLQKSNQIRSSASQKKVTQNSDFCS